MSTLEYAREHMRKHINCIYHTWSYTPAEHHKRLIALAYTEKNPSKRYFAAPTKGSNGFDCVNVNPIELCEIWDGDLSELDEIISRIEQGTFPKPYASRLNNLFWAEPELVEAGVAISFKVLRNEPEPNANGIHMYFD